MASLLLVFILIMTGAILKVMLEFETKTEELDRQKAVAESLAEENREKAEMLEKILGIREEIVEALVEEFSNSDMEGKLTIDEQTGAIVLDSNLLFEFNEIELKKSGKKFLREFMPKYVDILLSEKFSPYVAEIVIEGHSDPVGSYMYNMELSQKRALTVAEYTLKGTDVFTKAQLKLVRPYITVNGRSESELIRKSNGKVDEDASRRVEIQFRLKDDEMIRLMLDTVSGKTN